MDIHSVRSALQNTPASAFELYERRPGHFQLILPVYHEDGDMVDIFVVESPRGGQYIRLCDFGMSLMRLSYTYDVNSDARRRIFDSIIINCGVQIDDGNLYLDTLGGRAYEGIMQFAGCVQKICNMRYWSRETVRNAFYDDLENCVYTDFARFDPHPDLFPLADYPSGVDWTLRHDNRDFYVFGVRGNDKAKNVAISLLEFQKAQLQFISLVVHEDIEELGRRERLYITRNADTQYPVLRDFQEKAAEDIRRFAGTAL